MYLPVGCWLLKHDANKGAKREQPKKETSKRAKKKGQRGSRNGRKQESKQYMKQEKTEGTKHYGRQENKRGSINNITESHNLSTCWDIRKTCRQTCHSPTRSPAGECPWGASCSSWTCPAESPSWPGAPPRYRQPGRSGTWGIHTKPELQDTCGKKFL